MNWKFSCGGNSVAKTHMKVGFYVIVAMMEAVVLALALSLDAFVASFAYGSNKIKIPIKSVIVLNLVCSGILGLSLLIGTVVKPVLSKEISSGICFAILFAMGLVKLLDNFAKTIIRQCKGISKKIKFSLFNLNFALSIYADPEQADADHSKSISILEATSLAVALSLDGMAVGFAAALGSVNGLFVFLASFITDTVAVLVGVYIGRKLCSKLKFNIAWVSGLVLVIMAILKLG